MESRLYEEDPEDAVAMHRLAHAHEDDDADSGSGGVKRKKKHRPEEFHKVGGRSRPCHARMH